MKIRHSTEEDFLIRILFICHGNICRSPMAEFIMKYLTDQAGVSDKFFISSAATSTDDIGSDIYPKAKTELKLHGIPFQHRQARQIKGNEYNDWDLIIAMDEGNVSDLIYTFGSDPEKKVRLLMSFTGEKNKSIYDPWYTRNFERAYNDIYMGCEALLRELTSI